MKLLRIVTDLEPLAEALTDAFKDSQIEEVQHRRQSVERLELRYREGEGEARLTEILDRIKPLQPSVLMDARLEDADAELYIGDAKPLGDWKVKIHADTEEISQQVRRFAQQAGYADGGHEMGFQRHAHLAYGGASPFARQLLRWYITRLGVQPVEEKRWGEDDHDIWLYIPDPALAGKRPRERFEVEIVCDDYEAGRAVISLLEKAGFERLTLRVMDTDAARLSKFALEPGAFRKGSGLDDFELMQQIISDRLDELGVDRSRYPLEVEGDEDSLKARITLPLGVHRRGDLPPYVGDVPERFSVTLRTDDLAGVSGLRDQLQGMGFHRVAVEMSGSSLLGFQIQWGGARDAYDVRAQVKATVEGQMEALDVPADMELLTTFSSAGSQGPAEIIIDFPTTGLDDGRLMRRLEMACNEWEFTFKAPDPDQYRAVTDAMRTLQWKAFETEHESVTDARIKYGGAPPALVAWIREQIHRLAGIRAELDKAWDNDDDDIWVCMPAPSEATTDTPGPIDLSSWFQIAEGEASPLLEIGAKGLRIGEITLRRRAPGGPDASLVPEADQFVHYCLDQRTAETLSHIALSASLAEPCLLEGETSTSKTSSVLFLASMLNQPVVRLNLNGQTDTGELIGRYVPEGSGWRFAEGLIPQAMRKGWWVILDEVNLAEPSVLERLNPCLERQPELVLSEGPGTRFGPGGDVPVHADFRVFATMNPAEYTGRSVLSEAWRDRFPAHLMAERADELAYRQLIEHALTGTHPTLVRDGVRWAPAELEATPDERLGHPGLAAPLHRLAPVFAGLDAMTRPHEGRAPLGAERRERYLFSRRSLLAVLDAVAALRRFDVRRGEVVGAEADPEAAVREAVHSAVLDRIRSGADRERVRVFLEAQGF